MTAVVRLLSKQAPVVVSSGAAALTVSRGLGLVALAAVVACSVVAAFPFAVVAVTVLTAQELNPSAFPEMGGWFSFGHQAYLMGKVPPIFFMVAVAAVMCWPRGEARLRGAGSWTPGLLAAFAVWASVYAMALGSNPLSAFNQHARPFALAALAFVVGLGAMHRGQGGQFIKLASISLLVWAAVGSLQAAAGAGANLDGHGLLIFVDSGMGAIAMATALALVLRGRWESALTWAVFLAAVVVVLLSLRRNVWLGGLLAVCLTAAVGGMRLSMFLRVALAGTGVIATLGMASESLRAVAASQLQAMTAVFTGGTLNPSTAGHISDIEIAFRAGLDSPWGGVGPSGGSISGLVVDSGGFYIHNEFLMDWLRFGAPGLGFSLAIAVSMLYVAARVLRTRRAGLLATGAALFLAGNPASLMVVPYLSTSLRWATLVGLAAGVCAYELRRTNEPVA